MKRGKPRTFGMLAVVVCALVSAAAPAAPAPWIELDQGTVELGLTRTPEGKAKASATLRGPTLRIAPLGGKDAEQSKPGKKGESFPLEVDRLVVRQGTIVFVSQSGQELLRVHQLELNVENYTNRARPGAPTKITASGRIGREGRLSLAVTADPARRSPDFTGSAEITGLGLGELGTLVGQSFNLPAVGAKFTMSVDFAVHEGRISGTAKPALAGLGGGLGMNPSGVFDQLKSRLPPQTFGDLLPGQKSGAQPGGFSAAIPISGRVDPEAPLWTAIAEALSTSFLQAATVGFLQLPARGGT